MKVQFFLFILFLPLALFGQKLYYSQLEEFPNSQYGIFNGLPSPIQFNRTNVFAPKVNLNCQVKGVAITNYDCAIQSVGPGVPTFDILNEQIIFYPNYWISPHNMMNGSFFWGLDFQFTDFGVVDSFLLYGMINEYSSIFSYDQNNLIESFQSTEGYGASLQQNYYDFEWSNNNQICEVIKNNIVISSFQSDSLDNSIFQFDSLGRLVNYTNISDYSTFHTGPPLNNGYLVQDSMNFQYNENGKISDVQIKKIYNYILGSSSPDSLIIFDSNHMEMHLFYNWIEDDQVELTFNSSDNMGEIVNYSDIQFGSSYCSNEQLVSKIIFNIDSNEYITNAIYLDSNSTILNSYYYHFCDEDTVVYGCTDLNACNYDSEANYSGTVLSPSFGACLYAQEYYDCDGVCINDIDEDLVCNELEVIGCTDLNACNYDLSATDEGYCIYPQIYYDCDGNCINDIDNDEECDELDYDDDLTVKEIDYDTSKIIKIIDIFGIERKENRNGILLFYIYDNGKVEKKFFY